MKLLISICLVLICGCSSSYDIVNKDSFGSNIICFGNSITEGKGAGRGEDYPSILSKKLGVDVINAGISGDTTRDALERIKRDVLDKDPRLVIVEFGANDYFRKIGIEETNANIVKIIDTIQQAGAMVMLVEINVGIYGNHLKGYKRIARRKGAYFVPNLLEGIFGKPRLMSDSIHPNSKGYKVIADKIYEAVNQLLIPKGK